MHQTATIDEFRRHATTPSAGERQPTMLCVASLSGFGVHHCFGVTRDPAAEHFESTLFGSLELVTISVSAHNKNGAVDAYFPEALPTVARLLGPDVPALLREVALTSSMVSYFYLLADGDGFVAPSARQEAYLARAYDAQPVVPTP